MTAFIPLSVAQATASSIPKTLRYDEVSPSITYIGRADPGSSTADPVWSIMRISSSGTSFQLEWASAGAADSIWDNRASLSYS